MKKKRRKQLQKAEQDVKQALRPYTQPAQLWKKLGKIDLSQAFKRQS